MDATCWANRRGYGRFARELLPRLVEVGSDHEFVCFLDARAAASFELSAPNVTPVVVPQRVSPTEAAAADSNRGMGDMLRLTRAVRQARPDVFFSPSVYTYFPLPLGMPAVVTVMDAIPERFPRLTLPTPKARLFWRAKTALAVAQARRILTISDYAAKEVAAVHPRASGRIRVATLAPADVYRTQSSPEAVARTAAQVGLPAGARWFAFVGGFSPHKYVDVIVRALASLGSDLPVHLVLVGATRGDAFLGAGDAIGTVVAAQGLEDRVHWTGYLPDEQVRDLLAGAVAVVLPSASEGFGLPPVEGAAQGTPTIATTESPLPELLAGGGVFVPPGAVGPIAAAMRTLLADVARRDAMGRVARERALALSWGATAEATLATLLEAAQ